MENISNTGSERFEDGPASIPDAPLLGYRNYWYPVVEARRIGRRPISVKILGEDIVLFPGKDGKVAALVDRCPHRGTMLSRGRILFPGTLRYSQAWCPRPGFDGELPSGLILRVEDSRTENRSLRSTAGSVRQPPVLELAK